MNGIWGGMLLVGIVYGVITGRTEAVSAAVLDSSRDAVTLCITMLGIQSLVRYFSGHAVEGFTTVILLILIIGSIIMISLGIIGYYIAKIYEEVKGRPRYLISRKLERRAAGKENTEPAGHGKPADD